MLVQFGLLNEQMNETVSQLNHATEELASRDHLLQALMRDIDRLASASSGEGSNEELLRQDLVRENENLRDMVDSLTVDRQRLVAVVDDMDSEKSSQSQTIEDLRKQVEDKALSGESKERDLQSIIDRLTKEKAEIVLLSQTKQRSLRTLVPG